MVFLASAHTLSVTVCASVSAYTCLLLNVMCRSIPKRGVQIKEQMVLITGLFSACFA